MNEASKRTFRRETRRARARYLAQSMQLEEADVPGVVSLGIFIIAFVGISAVAWAAITPVEELARSSGQIIPAGRNHLVQHLEGGIVAEILVEDGERVEAGDVLVRLAADQVESELEQSRVREATLKLELARLQALDTDREPDFGAEGERYPELAERQRALYRAERANRASRLAVVAARIEQRQAELERYRQRVEPLKRQHALLEERRSMLARLHAKGNTSRAELLSVGARVAEVEADYQEVNGSIAVTRNGIAQARRELEEIEGDLTQRVRESIASTAAKLAEVEQSVRRLSERRERLAVRAPVTGLIQGMKVNTINEVVEPGGVLMEIVPVGDKMIVESRMLPIDAGHVKVGDPAHVAVDSFDVSKFGTIPGAVTHISASTYLDASNAPYYRLELMLERDHVSEDAIGTRLLPGMTVHASIVTGSKSVLDYILKPVYRGFRNAFHER